jgi:hypothetical protein
MLRGRPPKKKRNISGLKNQPTPVQNLLPQIPESVLSDLPDAVNNKEELEGQFDIKNLASSEQEDGTDFEFDEAGEERKGLTSTELGKKLAALSCKIDDDDDNHDWIPYKLRP